MVGNDPSALVVAVVVVLLLGLVLRWVFAPSRARRGRPMDAAASAELGLLTVVTPGVDRQEALRRRAVLQEAGIRSSMSRRRDGRYDVLVFGADARAARVHLGPGEGV
jgi:hypothetical protein